MHMQTFAGVVHTVMNFHEIGIRSSKDIGAQTKAVLITDDLIKWNRLPLQYRRQYMDAKDIKFSNDVTN